MACSYCSSVAKGGCGWAHLKHSVAALFLIEALLLDWITGVPQKLKVQHYISILGLLLKKNQHGNTKII